MAHHLAVPKAGGHQGRRRTAAGRSSIRIGADSRGFLAPLLMLALACVASRAAPQLAEDWRRTEHHAEWEPQPHRSLPCFEATDPPAGSGTITHRPVLFMIGAQKAGTTYLWSLLTQHPDIRPLRLQQGAAAGGKFDFAIKEPHVFDNAVVPRWKVEAYNNDTQPGWVLDASPCYADMPEVAYRIRRYFTHARFVVVLRDPVARAVSAWRMAQHNAIFHNRTTGRWFRRETLEQEIRDEVQQLVQRNCFHAATSPHPADWAACQRCVVPFHDCLRITGSADHCSFKLVAKGMYGAQLRFWLSLFPAEHFHVISFSALRRDPLATANGIFQFLNLHQRTVSLRPEHVVKHSYHTRTETAQGGQGSDRVCVRICSTPGYNRAMVLLKRLFTPAQRQLSVLLQQHGWHAALDTVVEPECSCT